MAELGGRHGKPDAQPQLLIVGQRDALRASLEEVLGVKGLFGGVQVCGTYEDGVNALGDLIARKRTNYVLAGVDLVRQGNLRINAGFDFYRAALDLLLSATTERSHALKFLLYTDAIPLRARLRSAYMNLRKAGAPHIVEIGSTNAADVFLHTEKIAEIFDEGLLTQTRFRR